MSFIVKGIKYPIKCKNCPFEFYESGQYKCRVIYHGITTEIRDSVIFNKLKDCPLVEMPDEHDWGSHCDDWLKLGSLLAP